MGRPEDTLRGDALTQFHQNVVTGDKQALSKLIITSARELDTGDQFGRTPLMYCVLTDRLDCAEVLIKANALINKKDLAGRTALHWAGHKGNFRFVKLLLSKGANWREKDVEGQTALHLSTRHKNPKCLAILLKQLGPGEVDDQDNNKRTALHWSCSYGNFEHLKLLIKQDFNIGIPDTEGKTPLHWAASCREGSAVHCVKLILETAPSVINWQDYEGRTALHLTVADGNEDIAKTLVSYNKCNVSALDNMFRTPLHWAAVLGHTKICQLLLDKNSDHSSLDSNGATPLHYASQNNYAETVKAFVSFKGVTDVPDLEGRNALMWAAAKGADDVIKVMVEHKFDLQKQDKNGGTALHAAASAGYPSAVKVLIKSGAHVNSLDLLKHTPLFRASEMGHFDVVQTLIDCRAKVDIVDQDGRSPLHWAALGGHAYICQTLLKFLGPNVRDATGRTPLQCAAYGGYVNGMSVLLETKADTNCQDNDGMSALHWACSKGHLEAVKLLMDYGAFPNLMEDTEDRYTPLDYALMGGHRDVAQYMVEQGALTVQGIQDIAAKKIQSSFKGFRVRRAFEERKNLLMKHEQLKKEAARKRAEEDYERKINPQRKQEAASRWKSLADGKAKKNKKGPQLTEDEEILLMNKQRHGLAAAERDRVSNYRRQQWAAHVIQRSWKTYQFRTHGIFKSAKDVIREKRLAAGENAWRQQIAALTIQLAWRKYYRRKLMSKITPQRKKVVQVWDRNVVTAKQRHLVEKVYGEQLAAPGFRPKLQKAQRPPWLKMLPSPAALSYNFAVDQYHPSNARDKKSGRAEMTEEMQELQLHDSAQQYSYNLQRD